MHLRALSMFALLVILLAACGGETDDERVIFTSAPTLTPTLRTTPLPTVASPVPLGVEEQPLRLAFIAEGSPALNRIMENMGEALAGEMDNFRLGYYDGLQIEVTLIESRGEALSILCNRTDTAVVVDVFTYVAAQRECGAQAAFRVVRDGETGTSFELVANTERIRPGAARDLSDPARNRFCTISLEGRETFIHPALALYNLPDPNRPDATFEIDLIRGTIPVVTTGFTSDAEMIQGLQGGGNQRICESAALPVGRFAEIQAELEEAETPLDDNIAVLDFTDYGYDVARPWPDIPYEVLVFPPDRLFPDFLREEVVTAINNLISDEGNPFVDNLPELLGEDSSLQAVEDDDYADFRNWLAAAGWNMAEASTASR